MDISEIIISSELFKPKQIAELKDRLLNFLLDTNKIWLIEIMFKELNLDDLPKEDFEKCLNDMIQDNMITKKDISGSRSIYNITNTGKSFLYSGGYLQQFKDEINEWYKEELDKKKNEEKRDLEIVNLRASIDHFRNSKTISIWAIVISIISILISIFKDMLFKLIN